MLYTKCIAYSVCKTDYLTQLKAVSDMATKMKLGSLMKAATTVINPVLRVQFPAETGVYEIALKEQTRSIAFIASRQKEVAALVKKYKIK